MAVFNLAYESTLQNEGGYRLHNIPGDAGGQTYAGIARKRHPDWPGWVAIDRNEIPQTEQVRQFYRQNFWEPIRGDDIHAPDIAKSIYDFAVNAGVTTAVRLAQIVCGTTPDGVLGPKTLAALNAMEANTFVPAYAIAKIARYRDIVTRDPTQQKFLLGWINRTLRGLT